MADGRCGTCRCWKKPVVEGIGEGDWGECWSTDRLDGDLSRGPAGMPHRSSCCEAYIPKQPERAT